MLHVKFSDRWWIDIPCCTAFFLLTMLISVVGVIAVETIIFDMLPYKSYWLLWLAPVVEETFKFFMLLINIPLGIAFTGLFAVWEAGRFIEMMQHHGNLTIIFLILRSICIGVHFLTLACQIFGLKMYYKYKSWPLLLLGYVAAIFIHFEWNVEVGGFVLHAVSYVYEYTTKILGT